ncbi:unnamed protein product [Symbiodinium sp. CCMP2456]|nr:unnamed protein product [Symbiodinium sp. CCMP2456]
MLSDELIENIQHAAYAAQVQPQVSPELASYIETILLYSGYKEPQTAQQAPAQTRRDLPQIRTSAGGLLSRALAAAKPANAERALQDFRDNVSARAPLDARWATWAKICASWGRAPTPLTPELIELVGTSFRFGGYRSSAQYFSRARKEHIKDAFRLDALDIDLEVVPRHTAFADGMVVLGTWFFCREIELAGLRVKHMVIDTETKQVTLTLGASKTDTVGHLVQRKHSCYCGIVPETLCPYHAALRIADDIQGGPDDFLFADTPDEPLSKARTIEMTHEVLTAAGIALRCPGAADEAEVNRFGGHCLRVSGAQHLCRMRVPVSTIMLLGRWGSRAIERYVQDTELEDIVMIGTKKPAVAEARSSETQSDSADRTKWTLVPEEPGAASDNAAPTAKKLRVNAAQNDVAVSKLMGQLDAIADRLEQDQEHPDLIVKKKAHARDAEEATRPPIRWRARCGWAYGYSRFTRAVDDGSHVLCKKCFPESAQGSTAPPQTADRTGPEAIVSAAGAGEELRKYIEDLGVSSVGEFDEAVVEPLRKPYKLSDGNIMEVLSTDFPVTRARLRHVWKKCRDASSATPAAAPAATTTGGTASTSSSKKELPAGYWQSQVKKFESVTIKGIARRFPETLLLGAEATLARIVSDAKSLQHNAIPLEEIVQTRHFKASGEPNNLSTAKKRSRSNEVTTLVLNADLQLEAEPEDRWRPQSQTAPLDCLQAIHMALVFVEYAPDHELDKYFEWWQRLVRSRPNKIEQLKVHWENTSWRIALALRKSTPFHDSTTSPPRSWSTASHFRNKEVAVERPTKAPRSFEQPWPDRRGGRGGKGQQQGRDWQPYRPSKGNGKGWGRGRGRGQQQWRQQRYHRQHEDDRDQWRRRDDDRGRHSDQRQWRSWNHNDSTHREHRDHE